MFDMGGAHELIHHGNGRERWAACSCDTWAWLGTYHPSAFSGRGRLIAIREAFAQHIEERKER